MDGKDPGAPAGGGSPTPPIPADRRTRRRTLAAALWPLAVLTYLHTVTLGVVNTEPVDFRTIYAGASRFLHGQSVYDIVDYLFFPGGLLLSSPLALLPPQTSRVALVAVGAVCVPLAGAVALRAMGVGWRSPAGAATLLGLALSESVTITLALGNVNTILALLVSLFVLLTLRRRDLAAGATLGVAIALKPVVGPAVLVALLARRWRTSAAAVVVAAALNLVGFLLVSERGQFLSITLPALTSVRATANSSTPAAVQFLHWPPWTALALRVLVLAVAAAALWWSRRVPDEPTRVVAQLGVALLATFLLASLTEMYWSILLLPLVVGVVRADSPMRGWPAWLGLYLFATLEDHTAPLWPPDLVVGYAQLHPTVGWALLLVVVAGWARRAARGATPAPAPAAAARCAGTRSTV